MPTIPDLLEEMRAGFHGVNERFDRANERFDRLESHVDERLDSVKEQLLRVMVSQWDEFHGELKQVNIHLESIDRRLELHAGALAHIVEWSNKYESEMIRLSKELADVQARLAKLESAA
jgi:chromosome segregation ATPase